MAEISVNKPIVYSSSTSDTYPAASTFTDDAVAYISGKNVKYYGKYIKHDTKNVSIGDVLYVDSSGNKYFYDGDTVTTTSPSGLTCVGVVINKKNNKVLVHYKKGMSGSAWDSSLHGTNNLFFDKVTNVGSTLNSVFPGSSNLYRRNNFVTKSGQSLPIYNFDIGINAMRNSTQWYITTDDTAAQSDKFATEATFNESTTLKNNYGTYDNYIRQQMLGYPIMGGYLATCYGKAKQWSNELAQYYSATSGDTNIANYSKTAKHTQPLSTMFKNIYELGGSREFTTTSSGLTAGNWYLIGLEELYEWLSNESIIDKTTIAFRNIGSLTSAQTSKSSHRWCCARYSSTYAWSFNTTSGHLDYFSFSNTIISVSAVTLLEL